jgi:putative FmdB family regulatory protein
MATYAYRCTTDGPFDLVAAMGTAPQTGTCPRCAAPARRVWTAPRLSSADPRRMALIDSTKATAERPEVVTALPPGRVGRRGSVAIQRNPALAKLPRP